MSTTIYNGYKLNLGDASEIFAFADRFRSAMKEVMDLEYQKMFAKTVAKVVDDICLGRLDIIGSGREKFSQGNSFLANMHWYAMEMIKRADKSDSTFDWDWDFKASLQIFMVDGFFYAMFFSRNRSAEKAFGEMPEVSDFHYQNQTDQPENVSDEEWERREVVWDEALKNKGVPSYNGLCVSCDPMTMLMRRFGAENILAYLPEKLKRAASAATDRLMTEYVAENDIEVTIGNAGSTWVNFDSWKINEGEDRYKQKTEEMMDFLPDLTLELLKTNVGDFAAERGIDLEAANEDANAG